MIQNLVYNLCESFVENVGGMLGVGKKSTPITYLTQWKIVGNSEVHGNEIWSCGEYNATDGKYHVVVLPTGKQAVDIVLDEPLRKVNDVADTIEFLFNAEGKALVTRVLSSKLIKGMSWNMTDLPDSKKRLTSGSIRSLAKETSSVSNIANVLCPTYNTISSSTLYNRVEGIAINTQSYVFIYDSDFQSTDTSAFVEAMGEQEIIFELATPTTELVDAPQIAEAESYSMVISQGSKAVSWSSFETE